MSKVYEHISPRIERWILRQHVFFVATAPLSAEGRVNVSPKGMGGTFAVLGERQVAYLDYTGSGAETIAHVRENGRITVMFCAFDGPPKIVRLHGRGRHVLPDDEEFRILRRNFGKEQALGQRSIVLVDVTRVSDACGFSVPLMEFKEDRTMLDSYLARRDEEYLDNYWHTANAASIDRLPALADAPRPSSRAGD